MSFSIRPFIPADKDFVLALIPRLSGIDMPPWRDRATMDTCNRKEVQQAMDDMPDDAALLIAEDEKHTPAGFIYLTTEADFFSGEKKGFISDLVVASQYEGQGVGRLLLAVAEDWSKEKGYRLLMLNVFAENERARRTYEKAGFEPEVVKYWKLVE
jgi:GNAT superfamily N-acetyltransferase